MPVLTFWQKQLTTIYNNTGTIVACCVTGVCGFNKNGIIAAKRRLMADACPEHSEGWQPLAREEIASTCKNRWLYNDRVAKSGCKVTLFLPGTVASLILMGLLSRRL